MIGYDKHMFKIHCKYDELVSLDEIVPFARNRNSHSQEQIERLAKLYLFHGVRHPIIMAKPQGVIAAGHGRLAAAKFAGMDMFPVVYQEFESDDALYTFSISDNASTIGSELDFASINLDLPDIGPFDIDMLGIVGFEVEVADKFKDEPKPDKKTDKPKTKECPNCGFQN